MFVITALSMFRIGKKRGWQQLPKGRHRGQRKQRLVGRLAARARLTGRKRRENGDED